MEFVLTLICIGLVAYIVKGKMTKNKHVSDWKDSLVVVAEKTVPVEFSYGKQGCDPEARAVQVEQLVKSDSGYYYLYGVCQDKGEHRHFRMDRIMGLIESDEVRFRVNDFIQMMKEP